MKTFIRGALASVALALAAGSAAAIPPPNLPLPPCETKEGRMTGVCPKTSPEVLGSAPGRFSFNATTEVYTDPQIPACNTWEKNGNQAWSPSPCYQAVRRIEVVGCGYVSLKDGGFGEGACGPLLYATRGAAPKFEIKGGEGYSCGGGGNFDVYYYGGPGAQPGGRWTEKAATTLRCSVTFVGPRPDGLLGPTWVKLRATIDVAVTGRNTSSYGTPTSTDFFVPIDGDLRDLGPVAVFDVAATEGGKVTFRNRSFHTTAEAMTYAWDFGDGQTSSAKDPVHEYKKPGTYKVKLTVKDGTGDENSATSSVKIDFALFVDLMLAPGASGKAGLAQVDEDVTITMLVKNPLDTPVTRFALVGAKGLRLNPDHLAQQSGPDPSPPVSLAPGQSITFTYVVRPRVPGMLTIEGAAQGWVGAVNVSRSDSVTLFVPTRLAVALTTSVNSQTKVGDEFDVTATLTNNEDKEIRDIKSQPLELMPSDIVTIVSGPTTEAGTDPRVDPITLAPMKSTTIKWRYKAAQKGVANLRALVSGRDPHTDALFFASGEKRIAIESAALEITALRMQPGSPVPGDFGNLRGVVANIGSVDITGIDFKVASRPEIQTVGRLLDALDPMVSPRIPLLAPDKTQEFMIPFGMVSDAGNLATYNLDLRMTGQAMIDGKPAMITGEKSTAGGLDLSPYWTNVLAEVRRTLFDSTLKVFEGLNDWGDRSTLGGITVGGGQGVLGAFQKMGDGLLKVNDVLGEASGDGGQRLTAQGQAIVGAVREYYHTTSPKKMWKDLKGAGYNVTVQGVGVLADWMYKIDKAQASGDVREVSRLLAEPATVIATGVGVEAAGAKLLTKFINLPLTRQTMHALKKAPDEVDDLGGPVPHERLVARELDDLEDMPTGVRITGETVERAGITVDEHGWMIDMAKEHGVAFFVRPRPEAAARFARLGFNAKPVKIKLKSVNEIDAKWLGFEDYADRNGLVVFREPKDPFPAMKAAVERGELEWGGKEIDEIIKRYNTRRAEWSLREEFLKEIAGGIDVKRYGKTLKTNVIIDADGLVRFSHNGKPVFSDVDIMHIARPDGTHIDPELHSKIAEEAGFGFDSQHGDTMATSDLPKWETATKLVTEYGNEHKRGGTPLVIVQPDVTTLGYVDSFKFPDAVPGSGYDLYGKVSVTYEGAGIK